MDHPFSRSLATAAIAILLSPAVSPAQVGADLEAFMDSARVMQTDVFAPRAWSHALEQLAKAQSAQERGRGQERVAEHTAKAREFLENAIKATQVARLSLEAYLAPRTRARDAEAPALVPELYAKAEKQFMKATEKVESGNVKDGLREAATAAPMFDAAELEAIRVDMLGATDRLIERARADEAEKYAPSTLDRARMARLKADEILVKDRYNRLDAGAEARRAEYEARHASNIAQSVRALERNDQAWEKLMLVYEIQMFRVGQAIGLSYLPFDHGPLAAADTMITRIRQSQDDRRDLAQATRSLEEDLSAQLRQTLDRVGEAPGVAGPLELARRVDERVAMLLLERDNLEDRTEALGEVEREHSRMAEELAVRREREDKFKKAKALITPAEGELLFNASNDIVLRLAGLSFDVGRSEIKEEHAPLLKKVVEIMGLFPDARYVVEGHTDATGSAQANQQLSEKRAYALMMYLREALLIPSDRIRSIGYGAERPIASNQSADGRRKNRRNDIIIMP